MPVCCSICGSTCLFVPILTRPSSCNISPATVRPCVNITKTAAPSAPASASGIDRTHLDTAFTEYCSEEAGIWKMPELAGWKPALRSAAILDAGPGGFQPPVFRNPVKGVLPELPGARTAMLLCRKDPGCERTPAVDLPLLRRRRRRGPGRGGAP